MSRTREDNRTWVRNTLARLDETIAFLDKHYPECNEETVAFVGNSAEAINDESKDWLAKMKRNLG